MRKMFLFSLVALAACASRPVIAGPEWLTRAPLPLAAAMLDGRSEKSPSHEDYLAMSTPYGPTRELLNALQTRLGRKLLSRGESHVTVITPPEFAVLSKKLTMNEINAVAVRESLQAARLEAVCIGSGQVTADQKSEETFFLVVRSIDLGRIRSLIAAAFMAKGGSAEAFDPDHYYPHITLGFTKTDLHEAQGVIKSEKSCRFPISLN